MDEQLKQSFQELGLSDQAAEIAARGRTARHSTATPATLTERLARQVARCDAAFDGLKAEGRLTAEIAADLVKMRAAAVQRLIEAKRAETREQVAEFANRYGSSAVASSVASTGTSTNTELVESFEQLGLSAADAQVAAKGR